jgi:hypothetical protein
MHRVALAGAASLRSRRDEIELGKWKSPQVASWPCLIDVNQSPDAWRVVILENL